MGVLAVVTTGIYCVPGCSARPHPGNVRSYGCPAAAEVAGFRACHRCRPYRTEQSPEGSALVARALELIAEGALDDTDEAGLAARLATSARHLRRRLVAEVGATADQIARSRRAHLARRLLDDTDLSISDIAFAAGFASLRQFNRVMTTTFRDTPRRLRQRRRRADRLVADGGLALRLAVEVDLDAWLDARARSAIRGVEAVSAGSYRRVITLHGDPGAVEIHGGRDGPVLVAHIPRLHGLAALVHRARRFVTGAAPWDANEQAVRDAVTAVVGQATANVVLARLAAALGRPVPGLGPMGLRHGFPTPAELAAAPEVDLGMDPATATELQNGMRRIAVVGGPYPSDQ